MIAADEWHKYQENYVKYGVALEPEPERPKKVSAKESVVRVSAREKSNILLMIVMIGICAIAVIFMQAWAASIDYNIYSLEQDIHTLEGDVENLTVQLNSGGGLDYVEYYASKNLGMAYPTGDQYVYVKEYEGNAAVDAYIAELAASQRGVSAASLEKNVSDAARHLLAGSPEA